MGGGIPASRVVAINPSVLGGRQSAASGPVYNPSPVLALSGAVMHDEGNSGTTTFVWTLTLYRFGSQDTFPFTWAVSGNGPYPANAADFGGTYPMGSGAFAPEETEKTITVSVTGDTAFEPTESFLLTVIAGGLNTVTSIGIISNDDAAPPMPSLSLSGPVTQAEGNSGTTNFVWTLTLNRDGSTASFPYSWGTQGTGSNPANGTDFVGGTFPVGSGTFAPGETSKTITAPVAGDTDIETDETFLLTVTASGLNSPTSVGTITNDDSGGGASPSYVGPDLVAQSSPTTYPPAPTLVTKVYHPVGAKLRVRAASTYADLIAGNNLIVNDASFTLTGNATTNQAGFAATLAGISTGKTFIDVRVEESPTVFSARSNPIMHGSASVPAAQASINFSVYSTFPLSGAITFAEPVYLTILGDDQISLELVGAQPGTSFTLRWLDNIAKNYDPLQTNGNNDFNVDHVYDYILRRRSLADVSADSTGAVTLLDYDTTPDAFSFAATSGAEKNTLYARQSTVFSGMAAGYGAPLTITGPYQDFRINNGTSWGSYLTDTTGVTLQNGYDLEIRAISANAFLTSVAITATVGGVSATWTLQTKADPTAASVAPASPPSGTYDVEYASTTIALGTITFGAGYPIVVLTDGQIRVHSTVKFNGVDGIADYNPGTGTSIWRMAGGPLSSSANIVVTAVLGAEPKTVLAQFFTGTSTVSVVSGSAQSNARNYGRDTNSDGTNDETANPMTVAAGNIGFMSVFLETDIVTSSWNNALPFPTISIDNSGTPDVMTSAVVPSSSTPSFTFTFGSAYPFSGYVALVWSKT